MTREALCRLAAAHVGAGQLPARYYVIEPREDAIEAARIDWDETRRDTLDPDEVDIEWQMHLSHEVARDVERYFSIEPRDERVRMMDAWLAAGGAADKEVQSALLADAPTRPWHDYLMRHGDAPNGELADWAAWWVDVAIDRQLPSLTPAADESGASATTTTTTTTTTPKPAAKDSDDKPTMEYKDKFARYTGMTLANGDQPFNVPDGTTYGTEGNYAFCEIKLADYEADADGKPVNGIVRMTWAIPGPTHKMTCSQWVNGFRCDWSGAAALKAALDAGGDDAQMREAMTKQCRARFDAMMADDGQPIPSDADERPTTSEPTPTPSATTPTTAPSPSMEHGRIMGLRPKDMESDEEGYYVSLYDESAGITMLFGFTPTTHELYDRVAYSDTEWQQRAVPFFTGRGYKPETVAEIPEWVKAAMREQGADLTAAATTTTTADKTDADKAAAEKAERERQEREKAEAERKAAAEKAERERQEREKAEADRKAAAEKAERERQEREKAEADRRATPADPNLDIAVKSVKAGIPVFLFGPAGTGKTTLAMKLADLLGLKFYAQSSVEDPFALTGFIDANGRYQETEFFHAFKDGGLYLLDEIAACHPQVLVKINAAISQRYFDFPQVGRIEAHPDFRVIAADNTVGNGADDTYTGRNALDGATLNRFAVRLFVGYDETKELSAAGGDKEIVEFAHIVRKAIDSCNLREIWSYRQIETMAKLKGMFDAETVVKVMLADVISYGGQRPDDLKMLCAQLADSTNKWAIALRRRALADQKRKVA